MLKSFLSEIKDSRGKEGKRCRLEDIPLFSVFAVPGGAVSCRKIHTFIKGHYDVLNGKSGLKRKKIPAYTTVRNIITGLSVPDPEESFRKYSLKMSGLPEEKSGKNFIACGGKTLRGSFDNFSDKKAVQILSAFLPESGIIPAHCGAEEKTDEIPAARNPVKEPGPENCIFTYDAANCQEKTLKAAEESSNDVIVCVKGNQKILLNDCRDTCELRLPCSGYEEPAIRERNRTESGKVTVFENTVITDKKNGKKSGQL